MSEAAKETGAFLIKGNLPMQTNQAQIGGQSEPQHTDLSNLRESRPEDTATQASRPGPDGQPQQEVQKAQPVRVEKKVGRNEPCPCGSGKKYKKCCGR